MFVFGYEYHLTDLDLTDGLTRDSLNSLSSRPSNSQIRYSILMTCN